MLSCIVGARGVLQDREDGRLDLGGGFKKPDKSALAWTGTLSHQNHEQAEHSLGGPGVADRNRQCGSGCVVEEDGASLFAII